MDAIDYEILNILQENARISITDLSKQINLSRPSVSERLTRLMDSGVIEKFTTLLAINKLSQSVVFYMEISDLKVSSDDMVKILKSNVYITEIHCVTGKTNYICKACMPSVEDMNLLLSELTKVSHVVTSVVLHSPLNHRPLKISP